MALLLNIDTATEYAGVAISNNGQLLALEESTDPMNHAAFVQAAIQKVISSAGCKLADVQAVAITGGPGSYTGLRVGLSSAKGLCYALNKPLIMVNTLEVMASATFNEAKKQESGPYKVLVCPMIDARRMEVFTAIYDTKLALISPPEALIIEPQSFKNELDTYKVIFSGSGSVKASIITHPNAIFSTTRHSVANLATLAEMYYSTSRFSGLAYSEPFYLKEFYKPLKKH